MEKLLFRSLSVFCILYSEVVYAQINYTIPVPTESVTNIQVTVGVPHSGEQPPVFDKLRSSIWVKPDNHNSRELIGKMWSSIWVKPDNHKSGELIGKMWSSIWVKPTNNKSPGLIGKLRSSIWIKPGNNKQPVLIDKLQIELPMSTEESVPPPKSNSRVNNSSNMISWNNINTTSDIAPEHLESLRNDSYNTSIIDTSFINSFFNKPSLTKSLTSMNSPMGGDDSGFAGSHPLFITMNGNGNSKSSLWIQTFGTVVNQGTTSASDGYDASTGGITIGMDQQLSNKLIIGINTTYSLSNIKARNSNQKTEIDTYQIGLYSGYNTKSYFLNTSLGISVSDYRSTRYMSLVNDSAEASYDGMGYSARAEIGKDYTFNNDIFFTPSLFLTAARNNVNSYDETGAGVLNLHVESEGNNYFETRIGGEIRKTITLKKDTYLIPSFSASYGYDFSGNSQKTTVNFIGQTTRYTSTGSDVDQGSLRLGTGVSFYTADNVTLGTDYELEKRTHYISHSGWLRAGYRF